MNLKQLATGVLSGYVTKAIQLVASLTLVPFLLEPQILGVEDYGRVFAIFGLTSLIGIATVGIHLAVERAIAQAVGGVPAARGLGVPNLLGGGTKVLFLLNLAFVIPLVLFDTRALAWIGIPPEAKYRGAILAAAAISVFENSLYLLRAPLLARGDIAYVNLVGTLEIVGRTATVFLVFSLASGNVATLMGLQAAFTLARQAAYLARLERSDVTGLFRARMSNAFEAVRYAGPVSLAEGSAILVRSVPVMMASRFLGATEAGYVALVANTLQGYVLQSLQAVVAPIAVPIASRFMLIDESVSRRKWFLELETVYSLGVAVAFGAMILWTPLLIPLWLGDDYRAIVLATQIMLAGSGVQTCTLIRRSVLIGQGDLPRAVPTLVGTALASTLLIAIGTAVFHSWVAAITFGSGYLFASSGLAIDRVFTGRFDHGSSRFPIPRVVGFALIFTAAWLVGEQTSADAIVPNAAWSIVGLASIVVLGFLTIISAGRTIRLVAQLYRAREIDLFQQGP